MQGKRGIRSRENRKQATIPGIDIGQQRRWWRMEGAKMGYLARRGAKICGTAFGGVCEHGLRVCRPRERESVTHRSVGWRGLVCFPMAHLTDDSIYSI